MAFAKGPDVGEGYFNGEQVKNRAESIIQPQNICQIFPKDDRDGSPDSDERGMSFNHVSRNHASQLSQYLGSTVGNTNPLSRNHAKQGSEQLHPSFGTIHQVSRNHAKQKSSESLQTSFGTIHQASRNHAQQNS